jgi:transposase
MKPYSLDLRQKIVEAYDRGEGSVRELAERFMVSPNTVQNYLTRRRRTGELAPSPHGGGPPRLLKRKHERVLLALRRAHNDRTDAEYAKLFSRRTGMLVSRRTINRAWHRLGITRKKKVLHASEQDRPDVRRARRAFRRRARRARHRRFLFVDEFGMNLGMTRRYGRARRGQRAVGKAPGNTDPNVTLTMGLSVRKIVAPVAFRGATDKERFARYLRDYLGPRLRAGDVVVLDRLGAHRTAEARAIVEARGASLWLLPAYSPDLTPVEEAGAKIKAYVRGRDPRQEEVLYDAIDDAIGTVTPRDARGWFNDRARYLAERPKRVRPPL